MRTHEVQLNKVEGLVSARTWGFKVPPPTWTVPRSLGDRSQTVSASGGFFLDCERPAKAAEWRRGPG